MAAPHYCTRVTPYFWPGAPCPENPTTRYLGAEIEVGREVSLAHAKALDVAVHFWHAEVHSDCAFEICTAPASGQAWVVQIQQFCRLLSRARTRADANCGCHIHIDARDLSPGDVFRLMKVICHVESALYQMVPPARRTNTFCRRVTPTLTTWLRARKAYQDDTAWLLVCLYQGRHTEAQARELHKHAGTAPRYVSFNFKPYFNYGTIECRLLEGCTNAHRIINWGVLLAALVTFAKQKSPTELDQWCTKQMSARQRLLAISPTAAHRAWVRRTLQKYSPTTASVTL